ncbi:MAG: SDR family NAD(P)-dependent oxidoreductase [Myxococcota bacterium]|nr:SDR family NAD(P)-dependent oxidoreductase [Myxococcota bacterium]
MSRRGPKKLALVTGGNAGIGLETCRGLLDAGFHVILTARTQSKADTAIADLLATAPPGSTAEALILDLASLDSVRRAAASFLESERILSVCVLNAGIMALPWYRTEDGFEQQWQVNVLGHFLLCRMLLPAVNEEDGRVIHLSSRAHRRHPAPIDYTRLAEEHLSDQNYDRWLAYGRSKLANILFSNELARRLAERGLKITSNAVHPGLVATNLLTNAGGNIGRGVPVAEGARTSIFVATSSEVDGQSGGYYVRSALVDADGDRTKISLSDDEGKRFWRSACEDLNLSEEL